jgi:hypothetical protein
VPVWLGLGGNGLRRLASRALDYLGLGGGTSSLPRSLKSVRFLALILAIVGISRSGTLAVGALFLSFVLSMLVIVRLSDRDSGSGLPAKVDQRFGPNLAGLTSSIVNWIKRAL